MADRTAQGTDHDQNQNRVRMPFAAADGAMYHLFSSHGAQQQQGQQLHFQQQQQQQQQHQVMTAQQHRPPATHSIHQAIASQNGAAGKV
ncbi:hypothetical protein GGH99_008080, partial [Coemansia sp. RSA 1285]